MPPAELFPVDDIDGKILLPSADELVARLNPRQADAVVHGDGPLMVVAGPGSGKTRVLTHRIAHLLQRGVQPWQILAVTFTNKAADEMRNRLIGLVGAGAVEEMWVSTFHSACVRILRSDHEAAGLPRSFTIVDADDAERLVRRILKDRGACADDRDARRVAPEIRNLISAAKNRLGTPADTERAAGVPGFAAVWGDYEARLAAMGAVDFDDLLLRVLRLFEDPDIGARWARRWRYLLIDEYQDTNPVQLGIARHLASGWGNITAVGDLDQSVYGFRMADPAGLRRFPDHFPGTRVVVLDQNYRSSPAILECARAVIAPNEEPHRAELWTDNPAGHPVTVHAASDDRAEARWVVDRIHRSGRPHADHAILVRTNALTRPFEEALLRERVPYKLVGGTRFYERAEIRDALAWVKVALNPFDQISFERAASAPRRGVGDKAVATIVATAAAYGVDLLNAAHETTSTATGRAAASVAGLVSALDTVVDATQRGPVAAVKAVLEDAGLRAHWAAQPDGETRTENLDELVSAAAAFCTPTSRTADGTQVTKLSPAEQTVAFVEHAALVSAADEDGAGVQIMTVHAAKGREFPVVFVVGLEEQLFPHARSLDDDNDLAEERRLLFVAVSRAEQSLHLSYAGSRLLYGKPTDFRPSRFLADLPATVVRSHDLRPAVQRGTWGTTTPGRPRPQPPARPASRPAGRPGNLLAGQPRAATAANTGERLAPEAATAGTAVTHAAFGPGTVVAVSGTLARIRFATGMKVLDLTVAPLRLA